MKKLSGNVTEARRSLQKLVTNFKNTSFRQQLAAESGGGKGASRPRKQEALSLIWNLTIVSVPNAFKKLKVEQDYKSFANLLTCYCYSQDDDSDLLPRLKKETLAKIRDFVVGLFQDGKIIEVAENELLAILQAMCSRRDFVGTFSTNDFDAVLDIIEPCLNLSDKHPPVPTQIVDSAAKALEHLVNTSVAIGITMLPHIRELTEWAVARCEHYLQQDMQEERSHETSETTAVTLLKIVAMLMRNEPEPAITTLQEHGRCLVSISKKLYARTSGANKDAVIGYLTAHLYVHLRSGLPSCCDWNVSSPLLPELSVN